MTTTEIPQQLSHRPVHQGSPLPFVTLLEDGVPKLGEFDPGRWDEAAYDKLCAGCGSALDEYWIYFIGSAKECKRRKFKIPPMHEPCARYFLLESPIGVDVEDALLTLAEDETDVGLYRTRSFTVPFGLGRAVRPAPAKQIDWFEQDAITS
jgi:hypothetical protein